VPKIEVPNYWTPKRPWEARGPGPLPQWNLPPLYKPFQNQKKFLPEGRFFLPLFVVKDLMCTDGKTKGLNKKTRKTSRMIGTMSHPTNVRYRSGN